MPSKWIVRDICKRCCVWYKPDRKEESACGGVIAIDVLGPELVPPAVEGEERSFENRFDELLGELVCLRCPFRTDGCDFRDPEISETALPCGGYVHLEKLLIDDIITGDKLRQLLTKENL